MDTTIDTIPWNRPDVWQAANASLNHTIGKNWHALSESRHLAHDLQLHLTALFPIMDRLCQTLCPGCTDNCCRRACVWADFKDLLFYHLADISVPGQQLLSRRGEHCRYAGAHGCLLDRIQRPFVCTWYLCPEQTRYLRKTPAEMKTVTGGLEQIKHLRREMEAVFIRAIL
jgi:hypothetical protein